MGITIPQILTGKVMHQRLLPKKHGFKYGIFYVVLPLAKLMQMPLAYNRFGLMSFYDKDHGSRDGSSLQDWADTILAEHNIKNVSDITLVCMPRILGYVFNPVSFWLCRAADGSLKAVLCEVHNTFGEQHTYICKPTNSDHIQAEDVLIADKVFHVSPFLKREGQYQFRFDITDEKFNVFINYLNQETDKQLITALTGSLAPQTQKRLRQMLWHYPLVTLKAILLIHWHAFLLVTKGIRYIPKPMQKPEKTSKTSFNKRSLEN